MSWSGTCGPIFRGTLKPGQSKFQNDQQPGNPARNSHPYSITVSWSEKCIWNGAVVWWICLVCVCGLVGFVLLEWINCSFAYWTMGFRKVGTNLGRLVDVLLWLSLEKKNRPFRAAEPRRTLSKQVIPLGHRLYRHQGVQSWEVFLSDTLIGFSYLALKYWKQTT